MHTFSKDLTFIHRFPLTVRDSNSRWKTEVHYSLQPPANWWMINPLMLRGVEIRDSRQCQQKQGRTGCWCSKEVHLRWFATVENYSTITCGTVDTLFKPCNILKEIIHFFSYILYTHIRCTSTYTLKCEHQNFSLKLYSTTTCRKFVISIFEGTVNPASVIYTEDSHVNTHTICLEEWSHWVKSIETHKNGQSCYNTYSLMQS